MNKPPLGIIPKDLYEIKVNMERIDMIIAAMKRYSEAGRPIPVRWVEELEERINEL